MIKGLQLAGPNPTHAAVIKDLRGLKSYNANGLLPNPIDYATVFGHDEPQQCTWVMQAEKTGFTPVSSKPFCGTDIRVPRRPLPRNGKPTDPEVARRDRLTATAYSEKVELPSTFAVGAVP